MVLGAVILLAGLGGVGLLCHWESLRTLGYLAEVGDELVVPAVDVSRDQDRKWCG